MLNFFSKNNAFHLKHILLTGLGGVFFSLDIPILKISNGNSTDLVFARGFFLFLSISIFWLLTKPKKEGLSCFFNGKIGGIITLSNAAASTLFILALHHTVAANLAFLFALNPVFCALIARFILKEKVSLRTWLVVGICFFGVVLIVHDGIKTGNWFGDFLGILVALCTATSLTAMRCCAKRNTVTSLASGNILSALSILLFQLFSGGPIFEMSFDQWLWVALDGLIVIPCAYALISLGSRYLPAPEVAMAFLLETFLTPIWIWLIFSEIPGVNVILGGGIILVTLFLHSLWLLRVSPPEREALQIKIYKTQDILSAKKKLG